MSYGYQPPKQDKPGSWSEVFAITRVAFGVLMPFLGALFGLLATLVIMILLFAQHPALGLIPLIPIAGAVGYLYVRERRAHAAEVARIQGD